MDTVDAVCSTQWMQWYMVVGTVSLVQKDQTSGHSMQYAAHSGIVVYVGGDIVFGSKRSNQWMQWMQYSVDAGHSGHSTQWNSGIWWWGHSLSLVQKGQTSGRSMQCNSDIWWWGHCLWCKKVKPVDAVDAVTQWMHWMQYAVDAVHSGIVTYGGGDIVFGARRSNQWMQWMQSHSGCIGCSMQWMQYTVE